MTNDYTAMAGHEMQHLIVPYLFNIVKLTVPRIIGKCAKNN